MATFDDFMKLDIRVGTITDAKVFAKARKPAYQLTLDFGGEIGTKKSSRQIADFMSEVLVLGTYSEGGVVLITPDKKVQNGDKLG